MRWPYIISSVALIGAGLLLFFNILCGASTSTPLNEWYWLEAQTESIPGAQANTRWTNYNSCGVSNGKNVDCSSSSAAYPMSPVSNFGTTEGVPAGLQSKHGVTYYLSKVGWAFLLIGLLFTLLALIPNFVVLCFPSRIALTTASGIVPALALLFTALSASLITAGYVKARNAFRDAGSHTSLGRTMIAFIWTSVFLLALSTLFSSVGCFSNFKRKKRDKRYSEPNEASSHDTYGNDYAGEKVKRKRGGFFSKRQKQEGIEDAGYAAGLDASRDAGVTTVSNTAAATTATVSGSQAKMASANDGGEGKNAAYSTGVGAITAGIIGDVGAGAVLESSVSKGNASDTGKDPSAHGINGAESGYSVDTSKSYKHVEMSSMDSHGSKNRDLTSSELKPYNMDVAADDDWQAKTSKISDTIKSADALHSAASEEKTMWASAAGFLGMGEATAAVGIAQNSGTIDPDIYRTVHSEVDPRNTDVGAGATHAGANAENDLKRHRSEFENKSTTLPVKNNRYTVREQEYGYGKANHEDSISEKAVQASASSGKPYRPVKEGAAVRAEDTYNNAHIGSKNKKDLTDTTGYEPTNYYNRKTGVFSSKPSDYSWSRTKDTICDSPDGCNAGYEVLTKSKSHDYEKTGKSSGHDRSYKVDDYDVGATKESRTCISCGADTGECEDESGAGLPGKNPNNPSGKTENTGSLEGSYRNNNGSGGSLRFANSVVDYDDDDDIPGTFNNGRYDGIESSYTTTRFGTYKYADEDSIPRAFREQHKNVEHQGIASKNSADIIHEAIEAAKSVI